MLKRWRFALCVLVVVQLCAGPLWAGSTHAELFASYGQEGAWLVKSDAGEVRIGHGAALVDQPLVPASSFKVFVALVALQTGALRSAEEIVPWDGREYPNMPHWQRDMALAEAMRTSSESYFGVLATRIGGDTLLQWLGKAEYGNQRIGDDPPRAWHDGVFAVSAQQQLAFIDRLRRADLPFAAEHQATVRDAMLETTSAGMRIYGKTGTHWDRAKQSGVAWWIGWVEPEVGTDADSIKGSATASSFVLQLRLSALDQREQRIELGKQLLMASGVLPRE